MRQIILISKLFLLWCIFAGAIAAGSVVTKVNSTHILKGEEVKISIIATGDNKKVLFPNFKKIGRYAIESPRRSQNVNISYINGKLIKKRETIYSFSIYPENNFTIPSFEVKVDGKVEKTKPVKISIMSHPGNSSSASDGYNLTMSASKKSLFVGEPLFLQVVFFEPRNSVISQAQYIAPKFDGFFVKSNKNEKLKQNAKGTAHIFDYILTPQKAGKFTIPAPRIKLGIQTFTGARDPWGFFNNEVHWRNIQGSPQTIEVKALPQSTDFVGSFSIEASVDKQNTKADKPVNYTLTIEGTGSLEDMDDPKIDIDGVTVYSDDAKIYTEIKNGEIHSKWVKKYTFIADQDFTIPAIRKTVFDPKNGKKSDISSRSYSIKVESNSGMSHATTPKSQKQSNVNMSNTSVTKAQNSVKKIQNSKENNRSLLEDVDFYKQKALLNAQKKVPWWSLIASFILGLLGGMLVIRLLSKRHIQKEKKGRKRKYSTQEALDILYPHTNDNKDIEEMVRKLYQAQKNSSVKIDKEKLQKLIASIE